MSEREDRAVEKGVEEHPAETKETDTDAPVEEQASEDWQAKAEEWLDKYRRSAAEFSNYRKRMDRERARQRQQLQMDLLRKLLPIVDDFERALANIPEDRQDFEWVEGVMLIERKLQNLLKEMGVDIIAAEGEPFDPNYHHALLREESEEYPEGIVLEELQKGYLLEDRVLRPTMVKVSSGPGSRTDKASTV